MKKKAFRILSAGGALVFLLAGGAAAAEGQDLPFADVSRGDWYYDMVEYVYDKGWMVGTESGDFQPSEPLSRGAFVTLLGRMAGAEVPSEVRLLFRDVPTDQYYAPYVAWAAEEGLVNGYTDGSFGPDDYVTRQDAAVILDRYLTVLGEELTAESAPAPAGDAALISDYAQSSVARVRANGLLRDDENGNFAPARSATRAEAAQILYALDLALAETGAEPPSGLSLPAEELSWHETGAQGLETWGTVRVEPRLVLRVDGEGAYRELVTTWEVEARLTASEELYDLYWVLPLSDGKVLTAAEIPGLSVTLAPMELKLTVKSCGVGEAVFSCTVESGVALRDGEEPQLFQRAWGSVTSAPGEDLRIALGLASHTRGELGGICLEAETDALLTLTAQEARIGPADDGRTNHACARCMTGEAVLELESKGSGTFRSEDGGEEIREAAPEKTALTLDSFYCSLLHPENGLGWGSEAVFGNGTCPNRRYRVELFTAGMDGERSEGLPVTVTREGALVYEGTSPCVLWLFPGEYSASAAFDGGELTLPVTVTRAPRSVTLWAPRSRLSLVVKTASGEALPGATVALYRGGRQVAGLTADGSGLCSAGVLPLGEYSVTVSHFLYQTVTETVCLTEDGAWIWKGFRLDREADPSPGVLARLAELREQFPAGKYWNHRGVEVAPGQETWQIVTDWPCSHAPYVQEPWENEYYGVTSDILMDGEVGIQCFGFASMLSDQIFGTDAPIRSFQNFDELRVGDQIRLTVLGHSMVVIEKSADRIAVAEVNADYRTCKIAWGRVIRKSTLESYGKNIVYLTRYPD